MSEQESPWGDTPPAGEVLEVMPSGLAPYLNNWCATTGLITDVSPSVLSWEFRTRCPRHKSNGKFAVDRWTHAQRTSRERRRVERQCALESSPCDHPRTASHILEITPTESAEYYLVQLRGNYGAGVRVHLLGVGLNPRALTTVRIAGLVLQDGRDEIAIRAGGYEIVNPERGDTSTLRRLIEEKLASLGPPGHRQWEFHLLDALAVWALENSPELTPAFAGKAPLHTATVLARLYSKSPGYKEHGWHMFSRNIHSLRNDFGRDEGGRVIADFGLFGIRWVLDRSLGPFFQISDLARFAIFTDLHSKNSLRSLGNLGSNLSGSVGELQAETSDDPRKPRKSSPVPFSVHSEVSEARHPTRPETSEVEEETASIAMVPPSSEASEVSEGKKSSELPKGDAGDLGALSPEEEAILHAKPEQPTDGPGRTPGVRGAEEGAV